MVMVEFYAFFPKSALGAVVPIELHDVLLKPELWEKKKPDARLPQWDVSAIPEVKRLYVKYFLVNLECELRDRELKARRVPSIADEDFDLYWDVELFDDYLNFEIIDEALNKSASQD